MSPVTNEGSRQDDAVYLQNTYSALVSYPDTRFLRNRFDDTENILHLEGGRFKVAHFIPSMGMRISSMFRLCRVLMRQGKAIEP